MVEERRAVRSERGEGDKMPAVNLTDQEWQQVLTLISEAPWRIANPLLMRIGNQLRPTNNQTNNRMPETPVESAQHEHAL